jgi:hypothetical protein
MASGHKTGGRQKGTPNKATVWLDPWPSVVEKQAKSTNSRRHRPFYFLDDHPDPGPGIGQRWSGGSQKKPPREGTHPPLLASSRGAFLPIEIRPLDWQGTFFVRLAYNLLIFDATAIENTLLFRPPADGPKALAPFAPL